MLLSGHNSWPLKNKKTNNNDSKSKILKNSKIMQLKLKISLSITGCVYSCIFYYKYLYNLKCQVLSVKYIDRVNIYINKYI